MKLVIDGKEYELKSESAINGEFEAERDGNVYKFNRDSLKLTAKVFETIYER